MIDAAFEARHAGVDGTAKGTSCVFTSMAEMTRPTMKVGGRGTSTRCAGSSATWNVSTANLLPLCPVID